MQGTSSSTKLQNSKAKKYSNGKPGLGTSPLDPGGKTSINGSPGSSKEPNHMPVSPGSMPSTGDADGESSEMTNPGDNIQVVVRVRPLSQAEQDRGDQDGVKVPGEGAVWIDNNLGQSKPFAFNKVFSKDSNQEKVFDECGIKHLIDMALEGYSCTVLAFGQTGSGKTYTLTGPVNLGSGWDENADILPAADSFGLMQRSFRYLIKQMSNNKSTFTLKASYLEVYNEKVQDLLELSSSRDSLVVRWSADRGFYVEDLFCVKCENEDDLMAVLEEGLRNRQVQAHCINDHSSRSHCMLTLNLDSETCEPEDDSDFVVVRYGRLSFVDLAGNERVKETKSSGELFTESQNINKSLLTLGNCISALSDAKKRNGYIPYRDSKLTKLLAKSIGGDGMTLMISCISPSSYLVSDTLNTLRYAQRAKKIRNKPVVQMDPKEKLILSLKREIKLLRKENVYFKNQLGLPTPASSRPSTTSISVEESWTDDGGESLTETTLSPDNEDDRTPTPWQTLSANMSTRLPPGLYDMLQEYMVENENLRTENGDLYTSRDTMRRQNIVISRENEQLLKKLEQLESRSSSAVSSSSRIPTGLSRVRSLTDDPKLLVSPTPRSPLPSNSSTVTNDRASYSAGPTMATKDDQTKEATASNVVSLPPVRKTRSNPSSVTERATKMTRQQQSQHTLLNIQKDVEWLAKHQSLQKSNATQSKQPTNNEVENASSEREDGKERPNGPAVTRSVKMSKIPQRAKEPSSYARIFAKYKASCPKKDEIDESESSSHEEPLRTNMNIGGSQGTFGVSPGAHVARISVNGINSNYEGQLTDPNDRLREDLDLLANQIDHYRHAYSETHGAPKNRPR